jgi:lipopolysaccharide export system protein LptA
MTPVTASPVIASRRRSNPLTSVLFRGGLLRRFAPRNDEYSKFLATVVAALFLLTPPALAQGIDLSHGGPIDITAQDGIEWLQNQHEVIALGNARAVRQNVTVIADRLIAYYRKKAGAAAQPVAAPAKPPTATPASADTTGIAGDEDTSGNEIYRVEAQGHVQIFTQTDHAQGDRAIYDLDKAVMVMTGHDLRLTTPNDVLTARDDLEYWSQKHMAVARGDAVVVTKDARRIAADVLVAYTKPNTPPPGAQPTQAAAKTGAPAANDDPLAASGKLEKVEAFGHVSVRTPTDIATGDRGVYVPETGIALLVGHVRITRGQNQLAGERAVVDLKTGVSRLLGAGSGPVKGLIVPNDNTSQGGSAAAPARTGRKP